MLRALYLQSSILYLLVLVFVPAFFFAVVDNLPVAVFATKIPEANVRDEVAEERGERIPPHFYIGDAENDAGQVHGVGGPTVPFQTGGSEQREDEIEGHEPLCLDRKNQEYELPVWIQGCVCAQDPESGAGSAERRSHGVDVQHIGKYIGQNRDRQVNGEESSATPDVFEIGT